MDSCFLGEISEVGAGGLGRVLGFVALHELGLDCVPFVDIDAIFYKPFEQTDSLVPEAHLKLQNLSVVGPAGDGSCVIKGDNEQESGDGVTAWLAVEEQDVG